MIFKAVIILFCLSQICLGARLGIVTFPWINERSDSLHNWIAPAFSELFFRKLSGIDQLQVWDPVFLFQIDSASYKSNGDTLLLNHRNKWQWDVAIGGSYLVHDDSIHVRLHLQWITGKEEPVKMELEQSTSYQHLNALLSRLILSSISLVQYRLSESDSLRIMQTDKTSPEAFRTYLAGYAFEMSGNVDAAITAYSRSIEMEPRFGLALCRLARLHKYGSNLKQAKLHFSHALDAAADDPWVLAEFADFLVDLDMVSKAVSFIQSHRKILETTAQGLKVIGKLYLVEGEYQRAVAALTKAVAAGPSDLDVEFSLSMAYIAVGETALAVDILNRLIRCRPDHLRYHATLGAAFRKAGKLMESSRVLESALKIDEGNPVIMIDLAHTYQQLALYQKAIQLLQRAHEAHPQLDDILINLGVLYWLVDRKDDARKLFNEAAGKTLLRQSAHTNIGNLFFTEGNIGKAIRAYRRAASSGKKHPTVFYNLAQACLLKGKQKKASYYFDELLRLSPHRIDILLIQAAISKDRHRYQDAEQYYLKILDISPYHLHALRGLVDVLSFLRRYEEAVKPVERYLNHNPSSKECKVLLAQLYHQMGWTEVAIMKYQFLVRDFPDDPEGYLGVGRCTYDLIKSGKSEQYEQSIYNLKCASERDSLNHEPDLLIGEIYMAFKGFRDLAIEHWTKALNRTQDKLLRKELQLKIARAAKE